MKVRRKSFKVALESFHVRYLGSTLTPEPGLAGIEKAVSVIDNEVKSKKKYCPKMKLQITVDGIMFIQERSQCKGNKFIPLKKISYGTMNKKNENIFAFNHHVSKDPFVVECHAVICDNEEKVKQIGIALYAAFRGSHFKKLRNDRLETKERSRDGDKIKISNGNLQDSVERLSTRSSSSRGSSCDSSGEDCTSLSGESNFTVDIGFEEQELDNIVQDMLQIVEREKGFTK